MAVSLFPPVRLVSYLTTALTLSSIRSRMREREDLLHGRVQLEVTKFRIELPRAPSDPVASVSRMVVR